MSIADPLAGAERFSDWISEEKNCGSAKPSCITWGGLGFFFYARVNLDSDLYTGMSGLVGFACLRIHLCNAFRAYAHPD